MSEGLLLLRKDVVLRNAQDSSRTIAKVVCVGNTKTLLINFYLVIVTRSGRKIPRLVVNTQ